MGEYGFNEEYNKILDEIIESRRSIRSFKDEMPSEDYIKEIIHVGMLAPYAPLLVDPKSSFRRFFVSRRDSKSRKKMLSIMKRQVKVAYQSMKEKAEKNPKIGQKYQPLLELLKTRSEKGLPTLGDAPFFIIVAEEKGPMPAEQWSIAHCLENMWLKATALGLAFQLISATEQMSNNNEFCKILDIPNGKYGLNGCLIGYPKEIPSTTIRPDPEKSTKWLD